jgi:lipoate-protein ligase A
MLLKRLINANKACLRTITTLTSKDTVSIVTATSTNIIFNLATEEYLFEKSKVLNPILFLWRNDKTIVIGKLLLARNSRKTSKSLEGM